MKKKVLSMLFGALLLCLCTGCGDTTSDAAKGDAAGTTNNEVTQTGPIKLTVWAEEDNFAMLETMIDSFKKANPSETFEFTLEAQGDGTLRDVALGDVHNTADVFHFPDDQLNSLAAGGILSEVSDATTIRSANTEASVNAASINGKIYAYPMTADNGYFLYYNKKYFTEDDVKTMDGILAVAAKHGKKLTMELNSGWYLYSFFGNTNLDFGLNDDGVTNYCNWNATEGAITGLHVATAINKIINHAGFRTSADGNFLPDAEQDIVIAAVSGVWHAIGVREVWGEDYGAVKLPTYTCNGTQVQMASFTGYKMVGVNSYSEHLEWAHKFAAWITNEENQTLRFVERNQGPSNIKAAASDEVLKVPAIQAVIDQSQYGVLQRVGNHYWGPCTTFIDTLVAGNPGGKSLQELLDDLVAGITASAVN